MRQSAVPHFISDGESCRLIVGGSPRLLRFFEGVRVAVVTAARDALTVEISGLVVLIAFLLLVLVSFLSSRAVLFEATLL